MKEENKGIVAVGKIDRNSLIVKSNELVNKPYKLSIREMKIVLLLASTVKKDFDQEFKPIEISMKELAEEIGITNSGSFYQELRVITSKLKSKGFNYGYIDNNGEFTEDQVNWLSSAKYYPKRGTVLLRFDPLLAPYLLLFKDNYTTYEVKNILKLKSFYSIRIYELLKQYKKMSEREFEIDELKEILGIQNSKMYTRVSKLKELLDFAKKELTEKCDLAFNYEMIKRSRKFVRIKFIFRKNEPLNERQASLFDADVKQVNEELKAELVALGFSEAVAVKLVLDYDEERILRNIRYSLDRKKKGKINSNFLGYTADAIRQDYDTKSPDQKKKEKEAQGNKQELEELEKNVRIINSWHDEYLSYKTKTTDAFILENGQEKLQDEYYNQTDQYRQNMINKFTFNSRGVKAVFHEYLRKKYEISFLSFVDWISKTKNVKAKQTGDGEKDIEFIN